MKTDTHSMEGLASDREPFLCKEIDTFLGILKIIGRRQATSCEEFLAARNVPEAPVPAWPVTLATSITCSRGNDPRRREPAEKKTKKKTNKQTIETRSAFGSRNHSMIRNEAAMPSIPKKHPGVARALPHNRTTAACQIRSSIVRVKKE